MTELEVQHQLCRAAIGAGGYAFKASHRFLIGVLDLFVQMPGIDGVWIEVKMRKGAPVRGAAALGLTSHQKRFIMAIRRAGGRAGWVMAVETGPGKFLLPCAAGVSETFCTAGALERGRGAPWPVSEIAWRIASGEHQC